MPIPRPLKNPPITEALLDIRVRAADDSNFIDFSMLRPALQARFPKMQEQRRGQVTFRFPPAEDQPPAVQVGFQGIHFKSEDEKLIAQFRIDGFTINRLAPYTSGNELLALFEELWPSYLEVAMPRSVTRLAMRYINHIRLPEAEDFGEYMTAPPLIPVALPQTLSAYFYRITLRDLEANLAAHITQKLEGKEDGLTLVLDIDAFSESDWAAVIQLFQEYLPICAHSKIESSSAS